MTRRDYVIIFCLLLPFFITLPWLIVSRQALSQQKELLELTRDTLHINNLKYARLQLSTESNIERNKALDKNSEALVQKLTEQGIKVATQDPVTSTERLSTPNESMEMSEPVVKNATSTERVSASNQNKETPKPLEANVISTERVSAPNQNEETNTPVVADESISAPVAPPASPTQPTEKKAPLYNLAPKGIRIIAIGERMQEQITRAGIEGLAGENFRIDLFNKEAAETSSSTQQRIIVEFDLNNVPASYHGARDLFLVLTDRGGEVVTTPQSTIANVPFNGSTVSLKTTAKSRAEFGNAQQLRIQQNLSGKLAKGRYRAQVYCDLAVLGMTDFEVL